MSESNYSSKMHLYTTMLIYYQTAHISPKAIGRSPYVLL